MTAADLLEIPEARERVQRWSVGEYERLVEQGIFGKANELIQGLVIAKMSKSPLHFSFSLWVYELLKALVPSGFTVRHEGPLRLRDSVPEPDVAIVAGTAGDYFGQHPTTAALVIEVAISSAALDREIAAVYAEANVAEYWILLPRERRAEVYRVPRGGDYGEKSVIEGDTILECRSLPGVRVPLAELFR